MSAQIALVQFGYQTYAVPVEALSATLAQFAALRKVSQRYDSPTGYVYWYDENADGGDLSVTVVPAQRIHATEPDKASKAPPAVPVVQPAPDNRVIAAPNDEPISIRSVPPMREFVDEYRHEEAGAA